MKVSIAHGVATSTLAAVILLAAGCTTIHSSSPFGLPSQSDNAAPNGGRVADPLKPQQPAWLSQLPAAKPARILSTTRSDGLESLPWQLTGISADGSHIDVVYAAGDGDCVLPVGFELRDTAHQIEIYARSSMSGANACADKLVTARSTITLPEPLTSGVTLWHGPVSPAWTSPHYFD